LSHAAIGRELRRDRSNIGRELRRNAGKRGYRPKQAHEQALKKRQHASRNTRLGDADWKIVERYIGEDWSPEQVSAVMKRDHDIAISHERIYQHILTDKKNGGTLYTHLRQGHRKRKKRYGSKDSRGRIPGTKSIEERPEIVDEKTRFGDWEIDTVIGEGHQQAVVTVNERHTGFALIGKVPSKHTHIVISKAIELLLPYKEHVHTITSDNGKEFAHFADLEKAIDTHVYFAHPYSSWERGANENYNGLVRQYIPKGSSMTHITQTDCDAIAYRLNQRPRKRLDFTTPWKMLRTLTAEQGVALQS